ncbi:ATP-dependent Clp protease ATP-binding subunit [Gracilinema caldarium]|uniref:ATPase AAA-2 domain protein n=1 Tax=Gracilinema caldarium (strain ATCC 51460 / DSM 7334 / H1) TaxID=744872 RepID=F8F1Q5_GRAC1|nr:AAA family ATPase [Gracilinema caldarium]AEJ19389.1 ATPase AAA-2 domain protein [Gracilinema caldarium DSM 7334]
MFKGLTQRAQRILTVIAQDEARRFHSDQLLPEHILVAVIRDGSGTACRALEDLAIDLQDFRHVLEREIPQKTGTFIFGDVPPSRRARTLLEAAAEEARSFGHEYVGTEHLLLASIREENSPAARYLVEKHISPEMLRSTVQLVLGQIRDDGPVEDPRDSAHTAGSNPFGTGTPSGQKNTRTPIIDEFSRDLTAMARLGSLDPVIGREKEVRRVVRILARRTKNNPILVGEPGVGKTAVVEALAQLIASENVPEILADKRLLALDLASVVAGTKYRGEFEERLKKIMKEISQAGNIILFIDEIHTVIGAGGAEGTIDASNMLKPALSRGEVQCIGATTLAEYRKHFEKDAALERRFQMVPVEEPSLEETIQILKGIKKRYEEHHRVIYNDGAVLAAATLAQRYITGRFMPDKAIDLLDEAGAKRKLETDIKPAELSEIENEIKRLTEEKVRLVAAQDYEKAAELRDQVRSLRYQLESVKQAWERLSREERPAVTEADIRQVVAEATGIPLARLEESASRKLLRIEEELHRSVIGQDDAVQRIAAAIRRSRAGVSSLKRPQGSFIFLGPTGVGKTLLAKRLAEYLFGTEEALVRIDMSDYMEKHNASRLVGAPPGYVGYEEGGVLTEKIRRNPYRVILFDEIEKAHHDVFNLLLQVLEEGELKDNLGHTVSFRNTVIIMTSNAGAREISRDARLGFNPDSGIMNLEEIRSAALAELKRLFNPEFINRVDDIVVFHALSREQVQAILALEIQELNKRLHDQGYSIQVKQSAQDILIEKGWDPKYGARPMRRAIQKELEDVLAVLILEQEYPAGTIFIAEDRDGKISIKSKKNKPTLLTTVPAVSSEPISKS